MLPWMWWVVAGLLALMVLGSLWLWMRAAGRRLALPGLPPLPEKRAVRELEALRKVAPRLDAADFAAHLTEIIRTFLHRQTGVLARYATSPELLGDRPRRDLPPPPPVIATFREVLTASDTLKYGPATADRNVQTDALIDSALAAVRAVAAPPSPSPPSPSPPPPPQLPPLPPAQATAPAPAGPS